MEFHLLYARKDGGATSGSNAMCITTDELQQLMNAVTVLQPFEAATRETTTENCFSVSALIPLAKSLMHFVAHCDMPLVKGSQTQLLHRVGAMESNHNLAAAILLDPQLKKIAFRDRTAVQQGMQQLVQEMSSLSVQRQHEVESAVTEEEPTTFTNAEHFSTSDKYDLWESKVKESLCNKCTHC